MALAADLLQPKLLPLRLRLLLLQLKLLPQLKLLLSQLLPWKWLLRRLKALPATSADSARVLETPC